MTFQYGTIVKKTEEILLEVTNVKQEQIQTRILGIAPYEGMQAAMERAKGNA